MFTIVVTGGLGAGKSTATEFFRARGATVIDLDTVGRGVLSPGSPTLARVVEEFGEGVLAEDGSLDRAALAREAFACLGCAQRLNALVHPAIAAQVGPALRDVQLLPNQPDVIVLEVPLLVEAPVYRELADVVVAVEAPVEARVARVVRAGMDEEDARNRIALQADDAERAALADVTIVNDGDPEHYRAALERFWAGVVEGRGVTA